MNELDPRMSLLKSILQSEELGFYNLVYFLTIPNPSLLEAVSSNTSPG
jgi:hypothetical protein